MFQALKYIFRVLELVFHELEHNLLLGEKTFCQGIKTNLSIIIIFSSTVFLFFCILFIIKTAQGNPWAALRIKGD